ncbi:MAG: hypothetical protein EBR30_20210 [Cytophagia bacterium]|nr:hypothetical protein [Cytophagia bacterium]NBW37296.1 hypothetical protein [Cytophagia bacterium]
MKRSAKNKKPFLNSYFIASIGTIVITILTAQYISDKSKTFKEIQDGTIVTDSNFYHLTSRVDWHKIKLGALSLETPKTYLYTKLSGIDSQVGQVNNQTDTLLFDFGLYSYDFRNEISDADFDSWTTRIDGRLFTIIKRKDGLGPVGAYTSDISNERRFNITCLDCSDTETALKIFETIKFRD